MRLQQSSGYYIGVPLPYVCLLRLVQWTMRKLALQSTAPASGVLSKMLVKAVSELPANLLHGKKLLLKSSFITLL